MLSRISLLAVLALLMAVLSPLNAAAIADVEFQDQVTVSGKSLQLNGLGLRTATAFKVKVYAIGLYLEESSSDAAAIINSSETKRIKMHFLHKVSADEISEGWTEGFKLMVAGERRIFWIPEKLAYKGKEGVPQGMLVFDIELVKIVGK